MPIYQYRDENGRLVATDRRPSLSSEQELQSRAEKINSTTGRINALGHFPLTPAQREEQRKRAKQTSELRKIHDKEDEEKKLLMEKARLEQALADLEREGYMDAVIEGGFGEKVAKSISEGNYDDAAEEIVKDYVEAKTAEKVIILAAGNWAKAWQLLKGVWKASKIRKLKKALQSKIAKRLEEIAEKLGRKARSTGTVVTKAISNEQKAAKISSKIGKDFKNHPLRQAYEKEVEDLSKKAELMEKQGYSKEEIAKKMWQDRRDIGEKYKDATPEPLRDYIYELNTQRYSDPLGPSFDRLIAKGLREGKSIDECYAEIINSSSKPNKDVNTLLSKFDDWLKTKDSSYLDKHS